VSAFREPGGFPAVKDFSIFEYALRSSADENTENLGELASLSRRDFEDRESLLCRTTAPSIEYACLMIENALLLRTNRSGRVYAGFEKLSCLQPVIERYLRIADVSESVYIFGESDWELPRHPNIRVITLNPDFRLARESFLISQSSSLNIALVAFDELGAQTITTEQIRFWAFKTSKATAVGALANVLEDLIDWTIAA